MERVAAVSPSRYVDAAIVIAASRAGGTGLLDIGGDSDHDRLRAALTRIRGKAAAGRWGLRWDAQFSSAMTFVELERLVDGGVDVLIVAGVRREEIAAIRESAARFARFVALEVYDLESALAAQEAGYDGVVVKGARGRRPDRQILVFHALAGIFRRASHPLLDAGRHRSAQRRGGGARRRGRRRARRAALAHRGRALWGAGSRRLMEPARRRRDGRHRRAARSMVRLSSRHGREKLRALERAVARARTGRRFCADRCRTTTSCSAIGSGHRLRGRIRAPLWHDRARRRRHRRDAGDGRAAGRRRRFSPKAPISRQFMACAIPSCRGR